MQRAKVLAALLSPPPDYYPFAAAHFSRARGAGVRIAALTLPCGTDCGLTVLSNGGKSNFRRLVVIQYRGGFAGSAGVICAGKT